MTGTYSKPFLSIDEQIALLSERGLAVSDMAGAKASLLEYGYYRLSGYSYPLRNYDLESREQLNSFCDGVDMAHVTELVEFDRGLRSLFMLAAERIEIAVRVQVAILLGGRDPWSHRNADNFYPKFSKNIDLKTGRIPFDDWIAKLDELEASSKEDFAGHFRQKYRNPPPIWVSTELWSFGLLSRLIGGMKVEDQLALGKVFGFSRREFLPALIRSINHVRNIAAHHSRLWNRSPSDQPSPPKIGEFPLLDHLASDPFAQVRLYGVVAPAQLLLREINPKAALQWADQLKTHFSSFPQIPRVPFTQTGFPEGWEAQGLWN